MSKVAIMFKHKRYTILIKEVKGDKFKISVSFMAKGGRVLRNDSAKIAVGKKGIYFRMFSEDFYIPRKHQELVNKSLIANEYFQ